VLSSPPFSRSARLQRFLQFIVESELTGHRRDIQEYTIGLEVFDRGKSFDPRSDSIVRVEAHRLRKRLKKYYATYGQRQPVRIILPQRGYVPSFERKVFRWNWHRRARAVLIAGGISGALGYVLYAILLDTPAATPSPAAIEAFEMGRTSFEQRTGEGAQQAKAFFQEAIAHDPSYARAYAWLSAAYREQAVMGEASFRDVYGPSSEAARKAVALDPEDAEAHSMLAIILTFEPRWREAEHEFQTAIQIDSDNATTHHTYGILLLAASALRLGEAEAELRSAVRLEPGNLANRVMLAKVLYFRSRYNEAREILEEASRVDPHYPDAMRNLAAVLVQTGEYDAAIRLYETAQQFGYLPWGDGLLGHALAISGDRPSAQAVLAKLESRYAAKPVAALAIATIQVGLEQRGQACDSLRQAWANRELRTRYIGVDPLYTPMRDRACFRALVDEMALADLAPRH
jgi:Tfp pilus assembly protein PilF